MLVQPRLKLLRIDVNSTRKAHGRRALSSATAEAHANSVEKQSCLPSMLRGTWLVCGRMMAWLGPNAEGQPRLDPLRVFGVCNWRALVRWTEM